MHASHEQTLADIEQAVRAAGTPVEQVDARIAEVLGVPTGYYLSYLLVWGAIEAHGQALGHAGPPAPGPGAPPAGALARAHWLTRRIAGLVARVHAQATAAGMEAVGAEAARIVGAVMELGQALRDLDGAGGRAREPDRAGHGREAEPDRG